MRQQTIDRFFSGRMFRRQFFPALVSAIVLSLGDVADGLVLGNRVGYIGLAAIALSMPVVQVFNAIMNGLGIGGSVRFSQQMAQGKREEALADFQGTFCVSLIAGAVFAVLGNLLLRPLLGLLGTVPEDGELYDACRVYLGITLLGTPMLFLNYLLNYYMKNDDLEKQASVAFTAGNVVDISLNVLLVLVLRLDVAGAAIATVAGQTVGTVISVAVICRRKGALKFSPMKPAFRSVFSSFVRGLSSSVEFLYSMIFLLIANRLLLDSIGGIGIAVLDVVLSVSYFRMNLCDATAKSALPVISTYYGEYNEDGMRLALSTALRYAVASSLILAAAVFLFPDLICRFFGLTEENILTAGREALRYFAVSIPLSSVGIMLANYYEARQSEKDTLLLSTLRGVLPVMLALIFMLSAPDRFWKLFVLSEAMTLAIFGLCKCFSGRPPFQRERVFRKTIFSRSEEITETTEEIGEFCQRWDAPVKQQYIAAMAVEEICVATLDNGFRGKEDGFIQLTMIALEDGSMELHIRDNADSFNPLAMEMNGAATDEDVDFSALGISAIKKKVKEFSYRHYQGFNTVIIRL